MMMMMMDYYLKFETEQQAIAVLFNPVATEDGAEIMLIPRYLNTDVIGLLFDEMDGEQIPIDGWHVNVRLVPGEDSQALEPYRVQPTHPRRVFA